MKRVSFLVAAAVAVACGTPGPGPGNDAGTPPEFDCAGAAKVTTAELQTAIFETRCKSCHYADNDPVTPGNMSSAAKTQELVGKPASYATTAGSTLKMVDANNPQNSSLYLKVLGGSPKYKGPKGESVGGKMPQSGTELSADEKAKIKSWICTGASAQ